MAVLVHAGSALAGLPSVESGQRPGPDALYLPASTAPQLENTGVWHAAPILISGAEAYRDGEFLYQDHLYDDRGALGVPDPTDPHDVGTYLYSPKTGTLTYPTDPVFANNAADLVELRATPLARATAFRVTLNTLADPERTAFTIALGSSAAAQPWPHGAGVSSPAELFLTVHGATADLRDAAGAVLQPRPRVTVDEHRRQFEVRVPHAAWDPGRSTVRMAAGVGLWDPQAGTYLQPALGPASEDVPGGASPLGAALFNVAFRYDEPKPDINQGPGVTMADAAAGAAAQATWWQEKAQAEALALGDVSPFFAEVDFAKLADGSGDESRVPSEGPMLRILSSRYEAGRGVDHSKVCRDIASGVDVGAQCEGRIAGRLQPYALYVPRKPPPPGGYGMTLLLHSLSANHNQYLDSNNQSQLGERGGGSLVATPSGRGPDGFYAGLPEADTFEVWADVARHYPVDADWAAVSGYSMGGFGTYRLLARWPDLFARGFSVVGIPGSALDQLASLRNTPVMAWNAMADELVNISDAEEAATAMQAAGLRFDYWQFPGDHLSLATNDAYGPGADFLGEHRVDRDPAHVTYVVDPSEDSTDAKADHAYWVSGLRVRDGAATGTIDARSHASGEGDPAPTGMTPGVGVLEGGSRGPLPYVSRAQAWGEPPAAEAADRLSVSATNVTRAVVDARRAGLSCAPAIDLVADGPFALVVQCAPLRRCGQPVALRVPRVDGARVTRVRARHRGRTVGRASGDDVRRVRVRRAAAQRGTLSVRMRVAGGEHASAVTVRRSLGRCAR